MSEEGLISVMMESGFDGYFFLAIFTIVTVLFARILVQYMYKGNAKYNGLLIFSAIGVFIPLIFNRLNKDFENENLEFLLCLLINIILFLPIYLALYKGKLKGKIKEFLDSQE